MSDRGSAVPFTVAALGLLVLVGAGLGVASALFARHRVAEAAADLGALAAASARQQGADPCRAASALVSANAAELVSCDVVGDDVLVTVRVEGPGWLGQTGALTASARAGPRW